MLSDMSVMHLLHENWCNMVIKRHKLAITRRSTPLPYDRLQGPHTMIHPTCCTL